MEATHGGGGGGLETSCAEASNTEASHAEATNNYTEMEQTLAQAFLQIGISVFFTR